MLLLILLKFKYGCIQPACLLGMNFHQRLITLHGFSLFMGSFYTHRCLLPSHSCCLFFPLSLSHCVSHSLSPCGLLPWNLSVCCYSFPMGSVILKEDNLGFFSHYSFRAPSRLGLHMSIYQAFSYITWSSLVNLRRYYTR